MSNLNNGKSESIKETANIKVFKYSSREDYNNNKCSEVVEAKGNMILNGGTSILFNLMIGNGDNIFYYFFNSTNSYVGVGTSNAAVEKSQTGLLGTKAFKGMSNEVGATIQYPYVDENNNLRFKSTFGEDEANFDWNEWCLANGDMSNPDPNRSVDTYIAFNRKVQSLGTKAQGSIWVVEIEVSLS